MKSPREIEELRKRISQEFSQVSNRNSDDNYDIEAFKHYIERDDFARDRDRILYTRAFRRLEHKAQVYSPHKSDHFHTRLTHTLEVAQIARSIAQNIGLNEYLTEAIAYGHDFGHAPFGHQSERILDEIMSAKDDLSGKLPFRSLEKNYGGFKHNYFSVKILDLIENKHKNKVGLGLSWQVLEGIIKHTKLKSEINDNITDFLGTTKESDLFLEVMDHSVTLEGQIVAIADEIAQRQHDLDDGFRDIVMCDN